MASLPARDPVADHLLTPQNAALVLIDYQPSQFDAVRSMDPDLLLENIVSTVKTAKAFGVPIVHSTDQRHIGTRSSRLCRARRAARGQPADQPDDAQLVGGRRLSRRVRATGRRSSSCARSGPRSAWRFPPSTRCGRATTSIPSSMRSAALREEAHRAGLERVIQAGGQPDQLGRARRASSSATGHARKRWPTSSRSCSPSVCSAHDSRAADRSHCTEFLRTPTLCSRG